jgi:hypothetical protein
LLAFGGHNNSEAGIRLKGRKFNKHTIKELTFGIVYDNTAESLRQNVNRGMQSVMGSKFSNLGYEQFRRAHISSDNAEESLFQNINQAMTIVPRRAKMS